MAVDLLGLQSQKRYREIQGQVLEDMLKVLLKRAPRAIPSSAVRALLRGMPAARVAKLIEILIEHIALPPGPVESGEEFLGWQHEQHCPGSLPINFIKFTYNLAGGNSSTPPFIYNRCLAGQSPSAPTVEFDWSDLSHISSSNLGIQKFARYGNAGDPYYLQSDQCRDRWIRKKAGPVIYQPAEAYQTHPAESYPLSMPDWAPSIPELAPLWLPNPPGGPRRAPARVRKASPFFETGPQVRTSPVGVPGPNDHPSRAPWVDPVVSPGQPGSSPGPSTQPPPKTGPTLGELADGQLESSTDGEGNTRYPPSSHTYSPPPKNVKERKVAVGGTGALGRLYGRLSEGKELIDDVWGALPKDVKGRRRKTIPQKLMDLWEHWDRLDIGQAVQNIIRDKSTDRIIGAAAQRGQKEWQTLRKRGLRASVGPQYGSRYTQHVLGRSHF